MLKNRFDITCLANEPAGIAAEMTGIATLDVYSADPAAKTEAKGPEWIKILPRGKFVARDGRAFDIDPELLVSRSRRTPSIFLSIWIMHRQEGALR